MCILYLHLLEIPALLEKSHKKWWRMPPKWWHHQNEGITWHQYPINRAPLRTWAPILLLTFEENTSNTLLRSPSKRYNWSGYNRCSTYGHFSEVYDDNNTRSIRAYRSSCLRGEADGWTVWSNRCPPNWEVDCKYNRLSLSAWDLYPYGRPYGTN